MMIIMKKKEVEKGEVWLSEVEILNLGGDLRRGGGLPDKKAGGWGWKGGFGEGGVGRLGAPPTPPPSAASPTFSDVFIKIRRQKANKNGSPGLFLKR